MAYGVEWRPNKADQCKHEAEMRACRPGEVWGLGYLYRFDDQDYSYVIDPDGDVYGSYTKVELTAFLIRSVTPCGWTIEANNGLGWRFINKGARKRYALPSIGEAKESFIARKQKQARIYRARASTLR